MTAASVLAVMGQFETDRPPSQPVAVPRLITGKWIFAVAGNFKANRPMQPVAVPQRITTTCSAVASAVSVRYCHLRTFNQTKMADGGNTYVRRH